MYLRETEKLRSSTPVTLRPRCHALSELRALNADEGGSGRRRRLRGAGAGAHRCAKTVSTGQSLSANNGPLLAGPPSTRASRPSSPALRRELGAPCSIRGPAECGEAGALLVCVRVRRASGPAAQRTAPGRLHTRRGAAQAPTAGPDGHPHAQPRVHLSPTPLHSSAVLVRWAARWVGRCIYRLSAPLSVIRLCRARGNVWHVQHQIVASAQCCSSACGGGCAARRGRTLFVALFLLLCDQPSEASSRPSAPHGASSTPSSEEGAQNALVPLAAALGTGNDPRDTTTTFPCAHLTVGLRGPFLASCRALFCACAADRPTHVCLFPWPLRWVMVTSVCWSA